MNNFEYCNPVRVVFGKGTISRISDLIPKDAKVLVVYGGGSIKKNGVYDQVKTALKNFNVVEFGGVEPNPQYSTLMNAVKIVKEENITFILSVGGGSTLDGSKFIAAAAKYEGSDPWDILEKGAEVKDAVPLADVITLPATGSEMNCLAVISKKETMEKLAFGSPFVFPKFSIIDPSVTFTLPLRQVANGIADTFVHVIEQYVTHSVNSPLQDRQAEAILLALLDEAPKVFAMPNDYEVRANLFWMATQALNGWLNVGVAQCWATHNIGHEITARTGVDHGRSLALVLPGVWRHQRKEKGERIVQLGRRVFKLDEPNFEKAIDATISATVKFFQSLGINATKAEYGVTDEVIKAIAELVDSRGVKFGDRGNIGGKEIVEILNLCD